MSEPQGEPSLPASTAVLDPSIGTGNWEAYTLSLDRAYNSAAGWKVSIT